jgi:NitT/TauT family transport system substrate-binding protein
MRRLCLLVLLCGALLGCDNTTDDLRIGSNRWLGYGPLYIADDLRWLEPSGFRLLEYPSTSGVLRAFRNGMLDVALLTMDETLRLMANGYDLEILLITNISAGADVLYGMPPLREPADLRGKRVGVEDSALGAFFLARILDRAGLSRDDLQLVSLPVQEHRNAMQTDRLDAVITFASEGPALLGLGARRLMDSRDLPNEIIDVLVVDRQRVSPQARRRLKSLWHESLARWRQAPDYIDSVLMRRLGLDAETLRLTREGLLMGDLALNRQFYEGGQLFKRLQWTHDYQLERTLLAGPLDYRRLLDCGAASC